MKQPSTAWHERIAPDEAAHLERVAKVIGDLHAPNRRSSARAAPCIASSFSPPRARWKCWTACPTMPGTACSPRPAPIARWCACQRRARYQANRVPDIRGFALKVLDVIGRVGAWRHDRSSGLPDDQPGPAPPRDSREFIDFIEAATPGPLPGLLHLFKATGWLVASAGLRDLFAMLGKKFNGFAAERFNTVAPLAAGPTP